MIEKEPISTGQPEASQIDPAEIEALDKEWYPRFEKVGIIEAFSYLDGNKKHREEQKSKFIAGEVENPTLDYPELEDASDFERRETELRQLKKDLQLWVDESDEAMVEENQKRKIIQQIYLWRVNESIANMGMLKAASEGNMRRFGRYSRFIYGEPSEDIFQYTVQEVGKIAEKAKNSDDENVKLAANDLLSSLPQSDQEVSARYPSDEEFSTAKKHTMEEFGDVLQIVGDQDQFEAPAIKKVFEQALTDMDIPGWQVVLDQSSRTALAVSQEQKEVMVPESRELSHKKMKALLLHEVGTHVKRSQGDRNKLLLLQAGLDRVEKGEEGVAKLREQVLEDEFGEFSGLTYQLAIGLARGLDGEKRDFRQTYEIMTKYYLLKNLIKGGDKEKAQEKAEGSAWKTSIRVFRGSDCKTPGACFTKDIAYREGQIGVWQVVADNPDEIRRFSVGKYDPANQRHIWILDQLGITDKDLDRLKK